MRDDKKQEENVLNDLKQNYGSNTIKKVMSSPRKVAKLFNSLCKPCKTMAVKDFTKFRSENLCDKCKERARNIWS